MPDKPSTSYNVTGLLACFAVACLCTSGPAWAALLLPFVDNIAGNVASDHFSRLLNLTWLPFCGKKENKPHPQLALRQALIVGVSKALEQLAKEFPGGYGRESTETLRKSWSKNAEEELEQDPPELSEWSTLLEGSSKDPKFNLLDRLHIALSGPNADYGNDEYLQFFKTRFPEYLSNHFQQALAGNHEAWVGWQVKMLNNFREVLTGLAKGQAEILNILKGLPELNKANFEVYHEKFTDELTKVANDLSLILSKLEDVEKKVDTYGKEHTEKLDTLLNRTKPPEPDSIADIISRLRNASRTCHQNFTGKGGRFQHLKISEAIFSGITSDRQTVREDMLQTEVKQGGEKLPLWTSLQKLWQLDSPHALLEGTGGMGKTVSLVRLWEMLSNGNDGSPVPVFIQLNEYNNAAESEKEHFILHAARQYYGKAEGLEDLMITAPENGSPRVLLLLDGFNEVTGDAKVKEKLLKEINRLRNRERYKGLQILLTSRYISDEQRPDLDMRKSYSWDNFSLLQLQPLIDGQITTYLGKPMPDNRQLQDLLRNPMMLTLYAGDCELPVSLRQIGNFKDVTTAGELLWNVEMVQRVKIGKQYSTDKSELALRRCVLEHLLPHLAWKMYREGIFFIDKESLTGVLGEAMTVICCDDFFETFPILDNPGLEGLFQNPNRHLLKRIVDEIACTELTLLVREANTYRFLHQNFRDYFAARHVRNQIEIAISIRKLPEVLCKKPLEMNLRRMLGEIEGEHHIDIQALSKGEVQPSFLQNNYLARLLELCRGNFEEGEKGIGFTVWNILSIWKELRQSLASTDLSYLDLRRFNFNSISLVARLDYQGYSLVRLKGSLLNASQLFFQGHIARVWGAAYSPDGSKIVSCSDDTTVKEWSLETGVCLQTFNTNRFEEWVFSVEYSPDGEKILSAHDYGNVKEWSVKTGKCLNIFDGHDQACSATYNSEGTKILSAGRGKVNLWSVETGARLQTFEGTPMWSLFNATFSPDGKKVLLPCGLPREYGLSSFVEAGKFALCHDAAMIEFSSETGSLLKKFDIKKIFLPDFAYEINKRNLGYNSNFKVDDTHINWVNYSSDGKKILTASNFGAIQEWSTETGECLKTFHTDYYGHRLFAIYSGDENKLLTCADSGVITEWSVKSEKLIQTFNGHQSWVRKAIYSPDGKKILSVSDDCTIREWSVETGECLQTFYGEYNLVISFEYSHDGKKVLISSFDGTVKEWSVAFGTCLNIFSTSKGVSSVAYSPDGKKMLFACFDGVIQEFFVNTGSFIQNFEGHNRQVNSIMYSKDGKKVLSASDDRTIREWLVETGESLRIYSGHKSPVQQASYEDGDKEIVSFTRDNDYRTTENRWSVSTGKCLRSIQYERPFKLFDYKISPDKKKWLTKAKNKVIEDDSTTFELVQIFPNEMGLFVQGCDFRYLHQDSIFTEEEKKRLRRYGAIFDDEDEKRWKEAVEDAYGE